MMKKTKWLFATILAFIFGVLCLAACNVGKGMAGTYYFFSAQMETDGEVKEYGIGDTLLSGIVAKRDSFTFRLKSDGSVKVTIKSEEREEYNVTFTGTWETVEGEPNKITITIEDDPLICECDGSTLIISYPENSMTIMTLKK